MNKLDLTCKTYYENTSITVSLSKLQGHEKFRQW